MKNVKLTIALIITIFLIIYLSLCQPIDYWSDINLNNSHLYSDVIKYYGKNYKSEIDSENKTLSLVYNGIKFTGFDNIQKGIVYNVEITTDN